MGDIDSSAETPPPTAAADSNFSQLKPGIAITMGIFTTVFSIILLLLLYVKHCRRDLYARPAELRYPPPKKPTGVDPKVIQSLPIFRFSSLRGQKEGLECAVCLNRFEPDEVMRLLPKCKHAFHVECVDVWLEANPTCPLCRYRVDPEDVLLVDTKSLFNFKEKATPRSSDQTGKEFISSGRHSCSGHMEIIVEKPRSLGGGNRGKSLDGWGSRGLRSLSRRDGKLPVMERESKHRVEHRIVLDEEGGGRRWSEVEAADVLYLGSEMIMDGGGGVVSGRSASEITGVSRHGKSHDLRRGKSHGHVEGVMKRWVSWISPSRHQQGTSSSSSSGV